MDLIGKRKDVSDLCGISERRVSDLVTQRVLPRPTRTGYDLVACTRAYIAFLQKHRGTMSEEQRLLTKAKREREQLRVERERGELIDRRGAEREAFDIARHMRDSLLAIPDRVSGLLAAEGDQTRCYALLTKELEHVCEALSAWCLSVTPAKDNGHDRREHERIAVQPSL